MKNVQMARRHTFGPHKHCELGDQLVVNNKVGIYLFNAYLVCGLFYCYLFITRVK